MASNDGGCGNNHGTIDGATWVSGIGAPVAQTALVSWNKGTNLALYSEQWNNATAWILESASVTANSVISPSGYQDADTLTGTGSFPRLRQSGFTLADNTVYTVSSFLKAGTAYSVRLTFVGKDGVDTGYRFNLQNGTAQSGASIQNYGNGWYRCSFTANSGTGATTPSVRFASNDFGTTGGWTNGLTIHAWGASVTQSSSVQPYIPTLATAQTSPVLLPQGLTANKDITGVNAFESARNPYALNLDGASWGEVHDNASLDFGTGSFTLEVWAKFSYVAQGSSLNAILTLGGDTGQSNNGRAALVSLSISKMSFYYNASSHASTSTFSEGDWVHLVGVYDETNAIVYINGAEESTTARAASSITNTDVKMIGRDSISTRYYNDQIAQPRIYNRALTATEVLRNYNADRSKFGL
jgi:hypothetical protein